MKSGLDQMEEKRRRRSQGRNLLPPRNPVSGPNDGPPVVIDEHEAPAGGIPQPVQPDAVSGPSDATPDTDTPPLPVAGVVGPPPAGDGRDKARDGVTLPDLSIDWADPMMHIVKPNRVAVDVSVETRFKAAAATAGSPAPGNTERVMAALTKHLAVLPDLVLARRPEEQGGGQGFFVRRAPTSRAEPGVPVHLRPKVGEWEVLGRIEQWVTGLITAGHPGRRKATKSEIITAALSVEYPPTT